MSYFGKGIDKRNVELLMGFLLGKMKKAKTKSEREEYLSAVSLIINKILPEVSGTQEEISEWDRIINACWNPIKYKKDPDGRRIPDIKTFQKLDHDFSDFKPNNQCNVIKLRIRNKLSGKTEEMYLGLDDYDFEFEDEEDLVKVLFYQSFYTFTWFSDTFRLKDPDIADGSKLCIRGLISTKTADPTNDSEDYSIESVDDPEIAKNLEIEVIEGLDGMILNPQYYYNLNGDDYLSTFGGGCYICEDAMAVMEDTALISNYEEGVEGNERSMYDDYYGY